jgi:hypothetical protein
MEWEGIDEGSVGGPLDVERVASGVTNEGGGDKPVDTKGSPTWLWDEEVGDMSAIVEETIRGATTNPCATFHWNSCWLLDCVISRKIFR